MFKKILKITKEANKDFGTPITSEEIQEEMHSELRFVLENNQIKNIEGEITQLKEKNTHIITKAERLKKLGFSSTPSTKLKNELDKTIRQRKELIKLEKEEIAYTNKYAIEFPSYKFVPKRIFDSVKERYDLYTASPERYIKEIPEKNIADMEAFMGCVKDTHEVVRVNFLRWDSSHISIIHVGPYEECERFLLGRLEYEKEFNKSYDKMYEVRERILFEITAPISHFNLEDSEIEDRKITTKRPVLDPIVSHEVEGGYIIATAWDKEAEIPEIYNPQNN